MEETRYDVVVAGAGLGGLFTAALLAKADLKVLVLEKNKQSGGCLQSFAMAGHRIDTSVHYVGSMKPGQVLWKLFHYLNLHDSLQWEPLHEDCFDRIIWNGTEYCLAQGYDGFIRSLQTSFPEAAAAIVKYTERVKHICSIFPMYQLQNGDPTLKQEISRYSIQDIFNELQLPNDLQEVLCGNNLLYGGSPKHTPFYLHALIMNSYIEGSAKCKSGSASITRSLERCILRFGGNIIRSAEVTGFYGPEGLIEYAACADGKRYFGKHFISGFHPAQTFERVFSPWNRPATLKRIRGIPNTLSCFMLHALVREQSLLYRRENLYIHLKDVWFDEEQTDKFPASFAVFFQEHPQQTGFASTFSVMCFMSYELCRQWEHTFHANGTNTRLDAAYQHFKTEYSQYILDSVLPYLKLETADIIKTEASTPLSFRDYLGSADGATYGMEKNAYRHAEMTLSTRTRIPNLFLTGQNINMHGVLGVCITSVLCAAELCGLDPLLEKINEAATG